MDGFINFYKESGLASNKALERIKKILGPEKAGFLGTLDPVAAGVLPVALGWGTRFFPYFEKAPKKYRAEILFGAETDTQDSTGTTTVVKSAAHITGAKLAEAMERFKGEITQVPPMFSAKKVGGRRLYEIARKGGVVERGTKKVFVHSLELESFSGEGAVFSAVVSRGTYIRTLCEDLGRALDSAARMGALVREEAHVFKSEGSWTLSRLEERRDFQDEWLLPLDYPLGFMPKYAATAMEKKSLSNGRFIFYTGADAGPVRLYSPDGGFFGVGHADPPGKRINPERVIAR